MLIRNFLFLSSHFTTKNRYLSWRSIRNYRLLRASNSGYNTGSNPNNRMKHYFKQNNKQYDVEKQQPAYNNNEDEHCKKTLSRFRFGRLCYGKFFVHFFSFLCALEVLFEFPVWWATIEKAVTDFFEFITDFWDYFY